MTAHDQWRIAGVLPGDYMEFDDWVVQKVGLEAITGIVYHKHVEGDNTILYMIHNKQCRNCNLTVPPALPFLARAYRLENLG